MVFQRITELEGIVVTLNSALRRWVIKERFQSFETKIQPNSAPSFGPESCPLVDANHPARFAGFDLVERAVDNLGGYLKTYHRLFVKNVTNCLLMTQVTSTNGLAAGDR